MRGQLVMDSFKIPSLGDSDLSLQYSSPRGLKLMDLFHRGEANKSYLDLAPEFGKNCDEVNFLI